MQKVAEVAKALNILPKLQLGVKQQGGGVNPTGPHQVKFVAEPTIVFGKGEDGKPRKELRFEVEENGQRFRWNVPLLNKEAQPNYLIERLIDVSVGDERVLEMIRERGRNYISVVKLGESPDDDDIEIPVREGQEEPLGEEPTEPRQ